MSEDFDKYLAIANHDMQGTNLYYSKEFVDDIISKLKEKDKEIEKLKERENMLQERFRDWKKEIEKERKYWLCERTGCCGRIKDSKKYSSLYQENKRLNNIINELEHHLYQEWLEWKDSDCESIYSRAGEDKAIYDYLQELKGSDKE